MSHTEVSASMRCPRPCATGATVRRDVEQLERLGKLVRTHGSVLHPDYAQGELPFARKARSAVAAKKAIAAP